MLLAQPVARPELDGPLGIPASSRHHDPLVRRDCAIRVSARRGRRSAGGGDRRSGGCPRSPPAEHRDGARHRPTIRRRDGTRPATRVRACPDVGPNRSLDHLEPRYDRPVHAGFRCDRGRNNRDHHRGRCREARANSDVVRLTDAAKTFPTPYYAAGGTPNRKTRRHDKTSCDPAGRPCQTDLTFVRRGCRGSLSRSQVRTE